MAQARATSTDYAPAPFRLSSVNYQILWRSFRAVARCREFIPKFAWNCTGRGWGRCNDLVKRRYKLGAMTPLRRAGYTEMTGCRLRSRPFSRRIALSVRRLDRPHLASAPAACRGPVWRRMRRKSGQGRGPRRAAGRAGSAPAAAPGHRPAPARRAGPGRRHDAAQPGPHAPASPRPVPRQARYGSADARRGAAPAAETPHRPETSPCRPTPRQWPRCDSRWRARRRRWGRSTTRDSRTT